MGWSFDGCEVYVDIAWDDGVFAATPTWTDESAHVRSIPSLVRSGRTDMLARFQPGSLTVELDNRARRYDPTYGPASVTFTGAVSNYWQCPDQAAFAGATQLDLRAVVSCTDWSTGTAQTLLSQYGAAGQYGWSLDVTSAGYLQLFTSNDGTAFTITNSGVPFAVDGQTVAVRVTWDNSAGDVHYYVKRTTPATAKAECAAHTGWTEIGTMSTGSTSAIFNSTAAIRVGSRSDGGGPRHMTGVVYYASAANAIDGTADVEFWPADAASAAATSWTASGGSGETWTGTGAAYVLAIQGPYYGRLTPGTPIRVRAVYNAVTYYLFTGYVRRWPQQFARAGVDATARVEAADGLAWLADMPAPDSPYGIALAAARTTNGFRETAYWPLREPAPTRALAGDGLTPGGRYDGVVPAGVATQPGAPGLSARSFGVPTPDTSASRAVVVADVPYVPAGVGYDPAVSFWCYLPSESSQFHVTVRYSVSGTYGWLTYVNNGSSSYAQVYEDDTPLGYSVSVASLSAGSHFVQVIFATYGAQVHVDGGNSQSGIDAIRFDPSNWPPLMVDGNSTIAGSSVSDVTITSTNSATADEVYDEYWSGLGRPGELLGARLNWLLTAAGVPAALMDLTADTDAPLGPSTYGGTYGTLVQATAQAGDARLFVDGEGVFVCRSRSWELTNAASTTSQATIGDAGVDPLAYDAVAVMSANVDDITNSCTVTIAAGASGSYDDEASIAAYGLHATTLSGLPMYDVGVAESLARSIVATRKDPATRVTGLTLQPRSNPTGLFPQVLGREIGERITVNRRTTQTTTPSSTTTPITSAAVTIEGIRHSITPDGRWLTTWATSTARPTAAEAGYFTLDNTPLGFLDAGMALAP